MRRPVIGEKSLVKPVPAKLYERYSARPVRTLSDYQMMVTIRAMAYMAEQHPPYDEEWDHNDLCATHFLVFDGTEPIGSLRLRWFAGFAKLERAAIIPRARGQGALKVLIAEAFELVARKGYSKLISHIQSRYWEIWENTFHFKRTPNRPSFWFSDYEYYEIEIPIAKHPHPLSAKTLPHKIIRPEGDWDRKGILENSLARLPDESAAA